MNERITCMNTCLKVFCLSTEAFKYKKQIRLHLWEDLTKALSVFAPLNVVN